VRLTKLVAPETHPHWDDVHDCIVGGTSDGVGNFTAALGAETNVSFAVTDSDVSLRIRGKGRGRRV
jgi:hypothetical protein